MKLKNEKKLKRHQGRTQRRNTSLLPLVHGSASKKKTLITIIIIILIIIIIIIIIIILIIIIIIIIIYASSTILFFFNLNIYPVCQLDFSSSSLLIVIIASFGYPAIQCGNQYTLNFGKIHAYTIYTDGSRFTEEEEVQIGCARGALRKD